jgi:anti-anti-sigma factor
MTDLRIETLPTGVRCIYLSGVLDIPSVQQMELKFTACTATYRKSVIVDLSEVQMITSVGIGMLVSAARALQAHNGLLILLNPKPHVEKVLSIAAIDRILPVEYELSSALKRISS